MSLSTPSTSQPKLPDLPFDIITEILSRLSVKSLIRFKCVSKSFLYLISNPRFIRSHLNNSSNIINYTHHKLILKHVCDQSGRYVNCLKSSSLDFILHSPSDIKDICNINGNHAVELDYPLKDQSYLVSIVGSCNGLVCILINNIWISIWNPSTGKSKELPALDIDWNTMYGFRYDHLNDDYKVVWTSPFVGNGGLNEKMVRVYSLKTKSWGNIGDFSCAMSYKEAAVLVNGVLHWKISVKSGFVSPVIIFSFNLGNETYGEIAQPNYEFSYLKWSLSVLEGCLCMCCEFEAIQADIWVMKKYGARDSWIKLCAIPYTTFPENYMWCCYSPLYMSMTGEILLDFADYLVLYDINSGKYRNYEFFSLSSLLKGLEATTFVESLVSPDNYDEVHNPQH